MKILYIEDDANNIFLVRKILEKENVDFFYAASGEEGVSLYKQYKPDIVLIDINLPGLGGHEVAKLIRNDNKDVKLVAVSASTDYDDIVIAQAIGFNYYMKKPIDPLHFYADICNSEFETPLNLESKIILEKYADKLIEKLQDKISRLEKANEKLAQADRMKSNFISVASHELRTPMVPILGYLEMLVSDKSSEMSEDVKAQLIKVYDSSIKLSRIIEKVVDIAKIEKNIVKIDKTVSNVSDIVEGAISNLVPYLNKRNITVEKSDVGYLINCDFEKTVYSLTQVVMNAIKFSRDFSKIYIGFENDRKLLYVKDNGVGIDKYEIENVFKPFFTGFNVAHHHTSEYEFMGKGIGLGLTIAKGFLDIQGFRLSAESEGKNKGSTFYIQFLEN